MGYMEGVICPDCGYSAMVSGCRDSGIDIVTDTKICNDCKELVDVIVDVVLETDILKYSQKIGKCPVCKRKRNQVLWDSKKKPCPKCGKSMEHDESQGCVLWD